MKVLLAYRYNALSDTATYHNTNAVDWGPGPVGCDDKALLPVLSKSIHRELRRTVNLPRVSIVPDAADPRLYELEVFYSIEALINSGWIIENSATIYGSDKALIISESRDPNAPSLIFPFRELESCLPDRIHFPSTDTHVVTKGDPSIPDVSCPLLCSSIGSYFSVLYTVDAHAERTCTRLASYLFFHRDGDASLCAKEKTKTLKFFESATLINTNDHYGISPLLNGSRYLMWEGSPAYRLYSHPISGVMCIQKVFPDEMVDIVLWYRRFSEKVSRLLRELGDPSVRELRYVSEKLIASPLHHIANMTGVPQNVIASAIASFEYDLDFFKEWVKQSKG